MIETRALIQANSGGGKSYAIRKLVEQMFGKVQIIILDIEGEFGTLREKFDFILAGENGDIQVSTRTAELLARKLLELEASAIIDLYELKQQERKHFVRLFLDSMINSPKELWHPCIVVVDEAHVFDPQVGDSEAAGSVNDLLTRGRKRGFCAIIATQRLSKLHKDAAAECNNKLIGRCGLDDDMKRGAFELGFTTGEQTRSLRELEPGEFYAFGPALSKSVEKIKVGSVQTSHPKIGSRIGSVTVPPTAKIKATLAKLEDLPQAAERERNDLESLKARNRELEFENRRLKSNPAAIDPQRLKDEADRAFARGAEYATKQSSVVVKQLEGDIVSLRQVITEVNQRTAKALGIPPRKVELAPMEVPRQPLSTSSYHASTPQKTLDSKDQDFGRCERVILKFLAMRQGKSFSKSQIGALTNYSPTSGGFNNSLSKLKVAGLVKMSGSNYFLADDAVQETISILGDEYSTPETTSLETYLNKLGLAPKKIYEVLLKNPDETFTKERLGELTGYSPTSGGFNNAISELNTLGLAERSDGGVRLNRESLEASYAR
ncbi:MAG: DUF87 domain-containing protein [Nitrososphaerota archaeon]|nr:DUF87 domain-containing protein [Nitrososphaerota archaeon]